MTLALTATAPALREGVRMELSGDVARFTGVAEPFAVRVADPAVRAVLHALAAGGDVRDGLPPERLDRLLRRLGPVLAHVVGPDLLRLETTARDAPPPVPAPVPDGARVRLSAYALCRTRHDRLVCESPLSTVRAVLVDPDVAALVAGLGTARRATPDDAGVLAHLAGAGLVEVASAGGSFPSDTDPTLRQWDFHDQLMHARVRSGRYDDPFGALYPHRGAIDPQPAVKPPPPGPSVPLRRPAWDDVAPRDPSLTAALEGRRSQRSPGADPLTLDQLGEFLYRVGRVRAHYAPADPAEDEAVSRPYPSGGRAYELELWPVVHRCAGLDPGVYYYDPVAHRLVLVSAAAADREAMLGVAARATGVPDRPDVLITLTSRFQRLSWKYRAIAYATTLRHTGVVYQTMYLVATAMGLAACGLGNGDADLSARVLGLDRLRESSVGDFLLGSAPAGDAIGAGPVPPGWSAVNGGDWPLRAAAELAAGRERA